MFFSEYYGIDSSVVEHYGAVDISFVCDIPLFIDPMLIFNSEKEEYKKLHEEIIRYFHFLYQKACDGLSNKELKAWFEFNEVPNNWLGYSMSGNKGAALGKQYARFLYKNIRFATNTNNITKSNHIEKIMLLYEGSGKDKISDLTVNLIKGFLCSYTEEFARKYLDKKYIKKFHVEKAYFNYETESFVSKEYELPYITSEKGKKEYVLLTPKDILREDEPAINRKDFLDSYDDVRSMIDNDSLRAYVNNYIAKAILEYEDNQKRNKRSVNERSVKKIEKDAFKELAKEYPELYDYYIKYVENNPEQVSKLAHEECTEELEKFYSNSKILIAKVIDEGYVIQEDIEAREEAKKNVERDITVGEIVDILEETTAEPEEEAVQMELDLDAEEHAAKETESIADSDTLEEDILTEEETEPYTEPAEDDVEVSAEDAEQIEEELQEPEQEIEAEVVEEAGAEEIPEETSEAAYQEEAEPQEEAYQEQPAYEENQPETCQKEENPVVEEAETEDVHEEKNSPFSKLTKLITPKKEKKSSGWPQDFQPIKRREDIDEDLVNGDVNPYTGHEYRTNSVRMHPHRIGYVQVYDRKDHKWTDMTEWAFLGVEERKKATMGKDYEPPIYLD